MRTHIPDWIHSATGDPLACPKHGRIDPTNLEVDLTITADGVEYDLAPGYTLAICPKCLADPPRGGGGDIDISSVVERVTPVPDTPDDDGVTRLPPPDGLPEWSPTPTPSQSAGTTRKPRIGGKELAVLPVPADKTRRTLHPRCDRHGVMEEYWSRFEHDGATWRVADGFVAFVCPECLVGRAVDVIDGASLGQYIAESYRQRFPQPYTLESGPHFTRATELEEGG